MKKILALLLTVGMVLGLFAGCGNSNTTPAGTAAAANPTAAAAADSLDGTYDITVWVSEMAGVKELTEQQNRLLDRVLANMADTTLTDQLKELADEKQALTDAISAAKADALRKANQESRVEEFREFIAQNSQGFTQYDEEVVRKMVERITVIDAETILVRLRDSDVEIEQTVC